MFIKNKKAQVSDTITWLVATMIIVVVLSISVFFTISISNQKKLFLEDREKDFLATKSITGFLRENVDLLEGKTGTDNSVEKLLEILPLKKSLAIGAISSRPGASVVFRVGVLSWDYEQGELDEYLPLGSIHIHGGTQLNFWANCYNSGCG